MKTILEQYDLLIIMTILISCAILTKCFCAISYQILLKESENMTTTKNQWLRMLMTKFESHYELKLPMKNPSDFLAMSLEQYRFLGISLPLWENVDILCGCIVSVLTIFSILGGVYYDFPTKWILIQTMTLLIFLTFLAMSELIFQVRHKRKQLTLQLNHYFENTLHPKYLREYLFPKEKEQYNQEYFEPETSDSTIAPDMQELIDSLVEESKITKKQEQQQSEQQQREQSQPEQQQPEPAVALAATDEQYELIKEIIKEYMM